MILQLSSPVGLIRSARCEYIHTKLYNIAVGDVKWNFLQINIRVFWAKCAPARHFIEYAKHHLESSALLIFSAMVRRFNDKSQHAG